MIARILAPGKLFLIGEYVVLEGHPAVVMAVDRYVSVMRVGRASVRGGLVMSARREAARTLGIETRGDAFEADSGEFYCGAKKLGLGSSAAVAVASVASVFLETGRDIESESTRFSMWTVAKAVHDEFQKAKGSGADLAASLFGGFVTFDPKGAGRPQITSWVSPADTTFVFVWTGRSASTMEALGAVKRFKERDEAGFGRIVGDMAAVARGFVGRGPASFGTVKDSFDAHAALMEALGVASGAAIVTPPIRKIQALAREFGGAAKPSGAGGGDFVEAAFDDIAASNRFREAVGSAGFEVFDFRPAARGVHAGHVPSSEETGNA